MGFPPCAGMVKSGSMRESCRTLSTGRHRWPRIRMGTSGLAGGKGSVLRITVAPTGMKDSKAEVLSSNAGVPPGVTAVALVMGKIYLGINRNRDIYRWDPTAHKFVVDDQFLLPIDSPEATPFLYQTDDGSVWTGTAASDSRRIARILPASNGTYAYRRGHLSAAHSVQGPTRVCRPRWRCLGRGRGPDPI